jgi:hypothetical protein
MRKSDCVHVGFVYALPELYHLNMEIESPFSYKDAIAHFTTTTTRILKLKVFF